MTVMSFGWLFLISVAAGLVGAMSGMGGGVVCKGAGLGLFIAKAMVEAQGGTIWVASTPGAGASFYFTLTAACGPPPVRDTLGRGGPERIAAAALHARGTGAA